MIITCIIELRRHMSFHEISRRISDAVTIFQSHHLCHIQIPSITVQALDHAHNSFEGPYTNTVAAKGIWD
jgi:hypothetical protein